MKKLIHYLRRRLRPTQHTQTPYPAFANVAIGTHEGRLTRTLQDAVSDRYLLAKAGASQGSVAVASPSDRPLGVLTDTGKAGDAVNLNLLGNSCQTQLMVAAGTILAGELLYLAANGRVQRMPTTPGTYYEVGLALSDAGSAGELVEVSSYAARRVTILAAFSGNASTDIGSLTIAFEGAPDKVRVLEV